VGILTGALFVLIGQAQSLAAMVYNVVDPIRGICDGIEYSARRITIVNCSILKADREKGDGPANSTQLHTPFTGDTIHRITEEVN
jgi:hypothetical protein